MCVFINDFFIVNLKSYIYINFFHGTLFVFIIYTHRYLIIAVLAIYLGVAAAIESNGENTSNVHYIAFSLMNLALLPLWLLPCGMAVREEEEQLTLISNSNNDDSSSAMLTTAATSDKDQTNGGRSESSANERNFTVCETLSELDFWLLWVAHFCGTANGLFFINNISQISQSLGGAKSSAALYVSILSVANAVGRMSAGFLSDRYASTVPRPMFFVVSLFLMFLGQGSLALVPSLDWLYVGCLIIGMSYGAFWALIPAMVIELFGAKNVGSNYQILSLAPAFGSVIASVVLSGAVYESHVMPHTNVCCGTACFRLTHAVTSLAALVGCVLATMLWYRTRSFYTGMNGGREMTRGDYGEL